MDSGVRTVILHLTPRVLASSRTGRGLGPWGLRPRDLGLPQAPSKGCTEKRGLHGHSGSLLRKLATPVMEAAAPARPCPSHKARHWASFLGRFCWAGTCRTECGIPTKGGVTSCSALAGAGDKSRCCPATCGHSKDLETNPTRPSTHTHTHTFGESFL